MTAEELITAAANCLHCGREHQRREGRDHRGNPAIFRSAPDGHMPYPMPPEYLAALRRINASGDKPAPRTRKPKGTR